MSFIANLRLRHKFMLIGLLSVLLGAVPATVALRDRIETVQLTRAEKSGVMPSGKLLRLVQLTQQHRGLSAGLLGGNASVAPAREAKAGEVEQALADARGALEAVRLGDRLSAIAADWKALSAAVAQRGVTGPESFARHSALVAAQLEVIEHVTQATGMVLDADAATYALIQASLTHLPELTEVLGQSRALGNLVLTRGEARPEERARLSMLLDRARGISRRAQTQLTRALEADAALRPQLERPMAAAAEGVDAAARLVGEQLVAAPALTLPAKDYFSAITRHIDAQFALIDDSFKALDTALAQRVRQTQRDVALLAAGLLALGLVALGLIAGVARSITRSLGDAAEVARRVADGDLSVRIEAHTTDEAGELLRSLQTMTAALVRVVGQVRSNAESVATASAQIAQGNADLSQRTEEQASNLQQTAASMEQLTGTVSTSAEASGRASQLATDAAASAERGGALVGAVVQTMQEISESSRRIADITGVIDGIAFQTNILALNAAVEAARAGDQGRGFAVVAGEVRTLARRSADAAREIKALIGASVAKVETGARQVGDAGASMDEIVAQARRVSALIGEVSSATAEQSKGLGQVGAAVGQLDQVTQQNAALVEESAAAAESLRVQATRLSEAVSVFRLAP